MEIFILLIVVGLGLVLIILVLSSKSNTKNTSSNRAENSKSVDHKLAETNTSLILKRGEVAYFDIKTTLSETRAERRHQSVFAGKRNNNSTFFGGSTGRSKSHQVLTAIDTGSLILTNKRLVFDGKKTNRNIRLNKIMSVDIESNFFGKDELEISIENRQKSMYFSTSDAHKYRHLILLAYQNS